MTLLGNIEAQEISSFEFYRNDPIIQYLEKNTQHFNDYQLLVQRGEEYGRKTAQAGDIAQRDQLPILQQMIYHPFTAIASLFS